MKLHTTKAHIERHHVQAENTFTIKTTAKAFDILSSGLYTDPITAVIRELSCNASDSHVAANKSDEPFELHLPNQLEPFFSIKDNGTGLSDDQIRGSESPLMVENENGELEQAVDDEGNLLFQRTGGLYTTYFDSTKPDSNDFIGALGLGSKSPFSYTTAFDVISRFNGTKYIYSIFLNENGIPSVALLGSTPTDEYNGIEVKITVEEKDFRAFENKAASILRYFPIKPKVTGVLHFSFVEFPERRIDGNNWFVAPKGWADNHFTAVQGNVPYRVNVDALKDILNEEERNFLYKASIVAYFNIGELDVAANREEIRYDDTTKDALVEKMRDIRKDITSEVEKQLIKYNHSYWTFCIEAKKLSVALFGNQESLRRFVVIGGAKNDLMKRYINQDGKVSVDKPYGHDLIMYDVAKYSSRRVNRQHVYDWLEPSEKVVVMYNNLKTKGITRVREHLFNHKASKILVIIPKAPSEHIEDGVFDSHEKERQRITEQLGNPDINNVDDVTEDVVSAKRSLSFYRYGGLKKTNYSSWSYSARYRIDWIKETDTNIDKKQLYVQIEYGTNIKLSEYVPSLASDSETNELIKDMIKTINVTNDTEYSIVNLVGVGKSAFNKIKDNSKWVNLVDLYKKTFDSHKEGIQFVLNMNATPSTLGLKQLVGEDENFVLNVKKLEKTSTFKKALLPIIENIKKYNDHESSLYDRIIHFDKKYGDRLFVDKGEKFYDNTTFSEYSMLSFIGTLNTSSDWQPLFDYIKLIDGSKQ